LRHTLTYTVLAMSAFAGNSILCRMALDQQNIDAGSFTLVRLFSGALTFLIILPIVHYGFKNRATSQQKTVNSDGSWLGQWHGRGRGSWFASSMLFVYAVMFSCAYITLDTGIGALILFGSVQITLIVSHAFVGHRIQRIEWLGLLLALGGFTYLVYPELSQPSLSGFIMMMLAGVAWGFYTLKGQGTLSPIEDTGFNFIRTIPFVVIFAIFLFQGRLSPIYMNVEGIIYASLSGVLASAIGYFIWYKALAGLSTIQASTVQLSVPLIAAFGGMLFLGESLSVRFFIASSMVLGGILLVTAAKANKGQKSK